MEEASQILERLGDAAGEARCLTALASLLESNNQLDAAEDAASRAINLFSEKGNQFRVCNSHRLLGRIYRSKGATEKAIHHFEPALGLASSFNWHNELYLVHHALTGLFLDQGMFDDAQTHVERVKSHAIDHTFNLGCAMDLQARVWQKQHRFEEAKAEALRAADVFEKLGAARELRMCKGLLGHIEKTGKAIIPGKPDDNGDPLDFKRCRLLTFRVQIGLSNPNDDDCPCCCQLLLRVSPFLPNTSPNFEHQSTITVCCRIQITISPPLICLPVVCPCDWVLCNTNATQSVTYKISLLISLCLSRHRRFLSQQSQLYLRLLNDKSSLPDFSVEDSWGRNPRRWSRAQS